MRGFTLWAVPVCLVAFACGCFHTNKTGAPETAAPPATPTHAYWQQVGTIFAQKSTGGDLPALVKLVQTQTDALRGLATEGVDADLVAAVESVIAAEDEVLRRAALIDNDPARLKESKEMAQVFAGANRTAAEAKKRVRGLQPALNARYGGGFAIMVG